MNRDQVGLFPDLIDDDMEEHHPGRGLEADVERLALKARGLTPAVPQDTGRPGDAPADLLKRYIDGSLQKIRSSRKCAPETPRQVALMWFLCQLTPACNTIADVRQDQAQALKQVGQEVTVVCQKRD